MKWEDLQPLFRKVVLRRGDKTLAEIAQEANIGRRTVCKLMKGGGEPRQSVKACVERFVAERTNAPSDSEDSEPT